MNVSTAGSAAFSLLLLAATARAEAPRADRPAQHPLADERGPRPAHGLLRRPVRDHAERRRARGEGDDLHARLVERPGLRPARTTLISGMYATSTGGEHMRSLVPYPAGMAMFPQLLREAGYYCTNNAKEDYNLAKPGQVWDESSRKAHWKNRRPGQPFFAVFNSEKSHESQIRTPPAHAPYTTRPRSASRPIIPTRRRCATTGRSITTASATPMPTRA